jgi:hypothetical protein
MTTLLWFLTTCSRRYSFLAEEALDDDAGVELAAGADAELDEPSELDFEPLSPEEDEAPSPELEPESFEPLSDFGADEDFDG